MIRNLLLASVAALSVGFAASAHAEDNKNAEMAGGEDGKVFRIGIIGGENEADRLRNFQCMIDTLPDAIGVEEVKLFPAADYDGTIQGLLGGTLDYAELGASGYAKAYLEDPDAVEPILTTVQTDGSTGYHSVMVARKDSGMTKLEDMKGKKLGFADPDSTSGFLVPSVTLPEAVGMPVKEFFGETGFGGGHENLVLGVVKGDFDAGTTWASGVGEFDDGYTSGNLHKMVEKGILDMEDLVELWKSPLIPNGPIVVRASMSDDMKSKFKDFMMKMPENDPECFSAIQGGDYKSYTEVTKDFYKPIIDARRSTIGG
ncbi:phosphonate ABC transporter substrate-binding protein [Notoacmeibacter sp. MSK16QG-6]|uniref:phosphonate ABC transporter substrate-binding protein n=1 Tax=Notoacmeibacter sp. MSK16QG-6 TaxID=2957982 RepID=UPI00209D6C4D|nr:phosphonate ABC transporter substrate-binding protein [Notoacmeibacter sp. MSK16QG-6]MCP1201128.1 phosphonate ABC transporter substrate-binding protein [Notoacmeibacter sp. MSK16QG-6]